MASAYPEFDDISGNDCVQPKQEASKIVDIREKVNVFKFIALVDII